MLAEKLPQLPVPLADLAGYIADHPERPLGELLRPYREYEAQLRQMYAQAPDHELLRDPHANVLPLFTADTPNIRVRARDLDTETDEEKAKYIMPLPADVRKPAGSPATAQSLREFQRNFSVFSESALGDLDWNNVVAAGSSVIGCLLPVPPEFKASKRTLREFYHQRLCPASDVDLFLYGLTEAEAVEKIKDIEARVRDSLLTETTTIRTKHAVTICSQYPTRHVQIVLRIYKSVSEILTGFDIDCSGAAYDGSQVYCTPRALQSYMTQVNHIDLSRRSPSYENRLSKYASRGFEVYWPELERSRIDPTIFERSFRRTVGLARLLVLECLPTASSRDDYLKLRREERGRLPRPSDHVDDSRVRACYLKKSHEDEVPDWAVHDETDISNYHTFTIPYGPNYTVKKIEKLCYARDLLLNAEWNQPEDRRVYLHRHPAFFGRFEDVAEDCCGYCPEPETDEEKEIAREEGKTYVSGKISFLQDDPGRQEIGSFNPSTNEDWTEMAYIGDTARLCQAIVDGDAGAVGDWLGQEGADPNTRDHTGRTPLHLAVISSTPEVVRRLVDAGARLVARLADGRTALHLAAERGDLDIVKILMDKSNENEAREDDRLERQRKLKVSSTLGGDERQPGEPATPSDEESDGEMVGPDESEDETHSIATGSFVKVRQAKDSADAAATMPEDTDGEPDFYDIGSVAWDSYCSPLHYAIISGHEEVVKLLCQDYGADVLMPVKITNLANPPHALLTLVLALALPVPKAIPMAEVLLSLGATSTQANSSGFTALHRYVQKNEAPLLEALLEADPAGSKAAINNPAFASWADTAETPLQRAIWNGNLAMAVRLLDSGAAPELDFETWLKSAKQIIPHRLGSLEQNKDLFWTSAEQPLLLALGSPDPSIALELIKRGVDVNAVTTKAQSKLRKSYCWYGRSYIMSALELARSVLQQLRSYRRAGGLRRPEMPTGTDECPRQFKPGSYQHWAVSDDIRRLERAHEQGLRTYEKNQRELAPDPGAEEKAKAVEDFIPVLEEIEKSMLDKGAKTFGELHPETDVRDDRERPDDAKPKTYEFPFTFSRVNDLTDARKQAYIDLFEAAWAGDLDTIKKLTLTSWDGAGQEAPLQVAVTGAGHHSPFSLALTRGHLQAAKAVMEIARAQHVPGEKPKARFRMETEEDRCCSGSDPEDSDDSSSGPKICRQIIEEHITIENVGQVSAQVKSPIKPLELLGWAWSDYVDGEPALTSPFQLAFRQNDLGLLKFLLGLVEQFTDGAAATSYSFPVDDFKCAIAQGSTALLAETIRRTGAGLPLEDLLKRSGVEPAATPDSYQGLSVYGKKRRDWAAAGREQAAPPAGTEVSPLLLAGMAGSIESVEWFLSAAPLRHYLAFSRSRAAHSDPRLQQLRRSPGGLESAIDDWLNQQRELTLHAAIFAPPGPGASALVAHLIQALPSALTSRSQNGATPLLLAAHLGRIDAFDALLAAGADPTARTRAGENLLHLALAQYPPADKLARLLAALPPADVSRLCAERSSGRCGGRTPLHQYLLHVARRHPPPAEAAVVVQLLARHGALTQLDGAGHTPLHGLVAAGADVALARALLDAVPPPARAELLGRESAVGRTPREMARERVVAGWTAATHGDGPRVELEKESRLVDGSRPQPRAFWQDGEKSGAELLWELLAEYERQEDGVGRRLVGLREAAEVARRLGEEQAGAAERYGFRVRSEPAAETAPRLAGRRQGRLEMYGSLAEGDVVQKFWNRALQPWQ